jgi:transcription antitermination factor NusG
MAANRDRSQTLREGDWVRLCAGPFAGTVGLVEKVFPKAQRLVVRVSAFRQLVRIEAQLPKVERLSG